MLPPLTQPRQRDRAPTGHVGGGEDRPLALLTSLGRRRPGNGCEAVQKRYMKVYDAVGYFYLGYADARRRVGASAVMCKERFKFLLVVMVTP